MSECEQIVADMTSDEHDDGGFDEFQGSDLSNSFQEAPPPPPPAPTQPTHAPPPPPSAPSPSALASSNGSAKSGNAGAAPRQDLLSAIREGKSLNKVDVSEDEKPDITQAGGLLGALAQALLDRRAAIKEEDDEDEEFAEDW